MQRKRIAEANKGSGKPKVGGQFELLDHHGNRFTDEDLKGRYSLVRFRILSVSKAITDQWLLGVLRLHPLPRHLP